MSELKVSDFLDHFNHLSRGHRKSIDNGIRHRIRSGRSRDEILDYLKAELGASEPAAYAEENRQSAPAVAAATAVKEPRDQEISPHKIQAVIREMEALQTSSISSHSGVKLEVQPRSLPPIAIAETMEQGESEAKLGFKALVLFSLISAATVYLVGAALEIYEQQLLPTILLEIFPLGVILFATNRFVKVFLSLAYGVAGLAALIALHSSDVSKARSAALDTNPEYQRLALDVAAMQKEIDGMPPNYRAKRDEKREKMKPLSDRMTEIEQAAKGGEDSKTGELKSHVRLAARILLFLGSLVFTHALSDTLSKMRFSWLKRGLT